MGIPEEDEGPCRVRLSASIVPPGAHRCVFKCTFHNPWGGELYKFAHVTLLEWVGNAIPHGPEGMSYVESPPMEQGEIVVWIRNIEGAVHLVPLELNQRWVVNNRVDYHIWNDMNDRL